MIHQLPEFDELQWEKLLTDLQEAKVVPIIGPELLVVTDPETGKPVNQLDWLAQKLAEKLGLSQDPIFLHRKSLSSVFVAYGRSRRKLSDAYTHLYNIVKQTTFEPPEPLRQLAQISAFDLFVTTAFDGLLAKALDDARSPGRQTSKSVSFNAQGVADLEQSKAELTSPVVFHLLGKAGSGPCYAITDEDVLEWVTKLQSNNYSPPRLSFELKHNQLLFLGLGYENWLTRFFIRMIKGSRLSDPRDNGEVIADSSTPTDQQLCAFLQTASDNTMIYQGGAVQFVDELFRRWKASGHSIGQLPPSANEQQRGDVTRFLPPEREMPPRAVFISYAHEDVEHVKKLKSALDAAGITAWFDLFHLESGDNYMHKIEANIRACSYFIPVLSQTTASRSEGFFHREWKWARDRRETMAPSAVFVLPVIVDDTPATHSRLTEYFPLLTAASCKGGIPEDAFTLRLVELLKA